MAVNANQEKEQQNTDSTLPDGLVSKPLSESELGFQSLLEVENSVEEGLVCLNSQSNAKGKMGKENGYASTLFGIDIEKDGAESPKTNDETAQHMKMERTFLRDVQRKISLQIGEKFMQLLVNQSLDLPKFSLRDKSAGEIIYDTSISRSRKYKRSASFNSRRVFLLSSILSIIGTMILIYLTLRVRQQLITAAASA